MAGASSDTVQVIHVDDEPELAELTATFLERHDPRFNVHTTTDPSDALDHIRTTVTHCVVSDYDMPGQSGIELLETVREEFPDLPFILYTGKGSEEVAGEAISKGVTDYLQKGSGTSQYEVLANRIRNAVEQHRAREYAAETEHRLQTIAENANDVLWKFTADWDELLFVNSPYEEIWGRSIDELRERPQSFLEGIHPEDRGSVEDAMGQLSRGESVDIEYRVNAAEGFGRWVWVQAEPVFDETGEVEKVVGFARDITERKKRVEEIERLKDRFQAFTEFASDVITVVDETAHIQYESPSVERVLGYDPEELIGTSVFEHVHPDDREELAETFEAVVRSPGSVIERVTYRFKHADGSWVWLESVGSNRTNSAINGFVVNSRDVTDRKDRERELQETKSQLEIAVAEKERQNQAFHDFHDIVTDSTRSFDRKMNDVLSLGVEFLDLDIGIISNIDPPDYTVEHVVSSDGSIEQGAVLAFSDTFCELVYEGDGPIAFRSPEAGDVEHHPCYQDLGLQAYLGEPLVVDGERYGTLNFSSSSPRQDSFTDGERAFIRTVSEWVSSELRRHRQEP